MRRINVPSSVIISEDLKVRLHSRIFLWLLEEISMCIFDQHLDGSGGIKKTKDSVFSSYLECSGLKANDEKTEILALGSNFLQKTNFPKHNVCEVIKILGIYFCYDERQRDNLNFRQTLKSIKKSVKIRKWRGLPFWELEFK